MSTVQDSHDGRVSVGKTGTCRLDATQLSGSRRHGRLIGCEPTDPCLQSSRLRRATTLPPASRLNSSRAARPELAVRSGSLTAGEWYGPMPSRTRWYGTRNALCRTTTPGPHGTARIGASGASPTVRSGTVRLAEPNGATVRRSGERVAASLTNDRRRWLVMSGFTGVDELVSQRPRSPFQR